MRMSMIVAALLLMPATARAQSLMIFGGYESDHATFTEAQSNYTLFANPLQGWTAGAVASVGWDLAFVGRVRGIYGESYASPVAFDGRIRPQLYTYEGGVPFTHAVSPRLSPFVEGLFGGNYGRVGLIGHDPIRGPGPIVAPIGVGGPAAEGAVGGGFDIHLLRSIGLESEARYEWSSVYTDSMNRLQVGVSFVWWPGRR